MTPTSFPLVRLMVKHEKSCFSTRSNTKKRDENTTCSRCFAIGVMFNYFCLKQDGGDPPLESETTVIVDVSDVSDNPPKFLRPIYLEQISENRAKVRNSCVVNIQVSRCCCRLVQ